LALILIRSPGDKKHRVIILTIWGIWQVVGFIYGLYLAQAGFIINPYLFYTGWQRRTPQFKKPVNELLGQEYFCLNSLQRISQTLLVADWLVGALTQIRQALDLCPASPAKVDNMDGQL